MRREALRFLLVGGLAALINWLARIALSFFMPLPVAVLLAYAIGVTFGFFLYRAFVFSAPHGAIWRQVSLFLLVNFVSAGIVLALTTSFLALAQRIFVLAPDTLLEAGAHGLAVGFGAFLNFAGHKLLTFRPHPWAPSSKR